MRQASKGLPMANSDSAANPWSPDADHLATANTEGKSSDLPSPTYFTIEDGELVLDRENGVSFIMLSAGVT